MVPKIKPLLTGLASYIPGVYDRFAKATGGTNSGAYCYAVWLKHLVLLQQSGFRGVPDTVAELGPGDSIGVGLAALLSGANRYYALDVRSYACSQRNLAVFDELVSLFRTRSGTQGKNGFPDIKPYLDSNLFPGDILSNEYLDAMLTEDRIESIRNALIGMDSETNSDIQIKYMVPWDDADVVCPASVDLVFSHAVFEHVNDLRGAYGAIYQWLKPGSYMSHQIDFRCHGMTRKWNGHWACPDLLWKLLVGRKPYLINREPLSRHIQLIKEAGFDIVRQEEKVDRSGIDRHDLALPWQGISDQDLNCCGALIQAVKK